MKRLLCLIFLFSILTNSQVRMEKDSNGNIVFTNKGSAPGKTASSGKSSSSEKAVTIPDVPKEEKAYLRKKVESACARKGLDVELVSALIEAESGFRHNVLSKKGAIGLMQVIPDTAKRFGKDNPWDLDQNIEAGTSFLAFLNEYFDGNIPLVLAGYNAGEGAVMKYSRKIPPYSETVRYVFRILDRYGDNKLVEKAKTLLASPSDYDRFYVAQKNKKPVFRVMYMHINSAGNPCYSDYPPGGVLSQTIYFKDE
jgi:hypothetical protein